MLITLYQKNSLSLSIHTSHNIHHITSSLRYPQGNGMAEKAVGIVKELYAKCDDIKLGLLLMKTTPVSNQCHNFQAPANVFFGHQ